MKNIIVAAIAALMLAVSPASAGGTKPASGGASITQGTYTPTAANVSGASSLTPRVSKWTRIGNYVTVIGQVSVTASAATGTVEFSLSLPIASNLTTQDDLTGTGAQNDDNRSLLILALSATDKADCYFTSASTSSRLFGYSYTYEVK